SVCWSNRVTGAVGVTRTGSPKRTMVRIVMFFRLTAPGDCRGRAGERSPSRGESGAQGLVQDHLDVVQGGSAACQGTFVEGGTVHVTAHTQALVDDALPLLWEGVQCVEPGSGLGRDLPGLEGEVQTADTEHTPRGGQGTEDGDPPRGDQTSGLLPPAPPLLLEGTEGPGTQALGFVPHVEFERVGAPHGDALCRKDVPGHGVHVVLGTGFEPARDDRGDGPARLGGLGEVLPGQVDAVELGAGHLCAGAGVCPTQQLLLVGVETSVGDDDEVDVTGVWTEVAEGDRAGEVQAADEPRGFLVGVREKGLCQCLHPRMDGHVHSSPEGFYEVLGSEYAR